MTENRTASITYAKLNNMGISYKKIRNLSSKKLLILYQSVGWRHAKHPDLLKKAIKNSDYVISAWDNDILVGLGRAITDWSFAVYIVDLLVMPEYQRKGIGKEISNLLLKPFEDFHNTVTVAEKGKEGFYKEFGFEQSPDAFIITRDIK